MKTVAIYFNPPGKFDYPFDDRIYLESYRVFTAFAAKYDISIVIVRGSSYQGNMQFSHGWRFVDDTLEDITQPITADLIYNKELEHDLVTNPGDVVLNNPIFDKIARDKWLTYQAFPQLMPATYEITNENWREVAAKITTEKVVLKPISGNEGRGIVVTETATLDFPGLELDRPYVAQEFIDSSAGIPGICEGMHDLRLLMFNGEPKLSFIRQPKAGSVLSNVAQGGSAFTVDIAKVPQQFIDAAAVIDAHYTEFFPRFYTADFFMQNNTAYLIETNTRPGFPHPETEGQEFTDKFYRYLIEIFKQALASKN